MVCVGVLHTPTHTIFREISSLSLSNYDIGSLGISQKCSSVNKLL